MPGLDRYLNKKRPSIEVIKEKVNHDHTDTKQEQSKEPVPQKPPSVKPMSLSPSSIHLFLECPRCFWMDKIKGIKRPSGPFPSLPNGMDRVLKTHFDRHRGENTAPEELEGKFRGRLFQDVEKLKIWRNNYRGLRYTDKKSGFILMGALDDLFVTEDGKHAPLDFKTRGFPRKEDTHSYYQHQMDIYSLLLEKNGLPPAGFAILIFYHPVGVNATHDVVFDPDPVRVPVSRSHGEKIFLDAVKCLQGAEPEPSKGCKWCDWKEK
jgi:hypothetical protein